MKPKMLHRLRASRSRTWREPDGQDDDARRLRDRNRLVAAPPRDLRQGQTARVRTDRSRRVCSTKAHWPLCFDVATRHAALFQVLLVVVLGGEERDCGDDLRDYRFGVAAGFLQ